MTRIILPLFKLVIYMCFIAQMLSCSKVDFTLDDVVVFPNPYTPKKVSSFINIRRKLSGALQQVLSKDGDVVINISNIYNDTVFTRTFNKGEEVRWAGIDSRGDRVPAGIYFIKIIYIKETNSVGTTVEKIIIN